MPVATPMPASATPIASPREASKVRVVPATHRVVITEALPSESRPVSSHHCVMSPLARPIEEKIRTNGAMPISAIRRGPSRSSTRPAMGTISSPASICTVSAEENWVRLQPNSSVIATMNTPLE